MDRYLALATLMVAGVSLAAGPAVSLSPSAPTVRAGSTRQFTATVTGLDDTRVRYLVNNVAGGNATVGTVDAAGLYTAPATVPSPATVTVKAVSVSNGSLSDTSAVALQNPWPSLTALEPRGINIGAFALTLTGRGFVRNSTVTLAGRAVTTTYVSATELRIAGSTPDPAGTEVSLVVCNPDPGAACTGGWRLTVMPPVSVNVWPDAATLRAGATRQLNFSVSNSSNRAVTFSVNGVTGGNATVGTVSPEGLYTAPAVVPTPNTVTVRAVAAADNRASDSAAVTLQHPVPVLTSMTPTTTGFGTATLTLTGTGFVSATRLTAQVTTRPVVGGTVAVTVTNPDPGTATSAFLPSRLAPASPRVPYAAAVRWLEQATWGPTPESIARVQEVGFETWLNEQKAAALSRLSDPAVEPQYLGPTQKEFFVNALTAPDQLRQRMAFTLGQVLVVSGNKVGRADQMVPYLRLLQQHAFGNYLDLMRAVTLSPTMGRYLDMVNNEKANASGTRVPNENYARELLQLFTLGTVTLSAEGTPQAGAPPTYDQATVEHLARALTGWTYPTRPGATPQWRNPAYHTGPMEPFDAYHDTGVKTLLNGRTLPAGQTARQDLEDALRNVFEHPNVGPFVALRMIQHFVMSNPSPAYVGRVAAAFNNNGQGVRGDLWAVLKATLLDAEARAGDATMSDVGPGGGHLREPVLLITGLLRALGGTVTADHYLASRANDMGQNLLSPPSVFNYYSPFYRLPGGTLAAPEFQLLTPSTALVRANLVNTLVLNWFGPTIQFDVTPFQLLAGNPSELVGAVDRALLRGQMTAPMRDAVLAAVNGTTDLRQRARIALYLAGCSSQYQVAR